jgi:hypothetical protein
MRNIGCMASAVMGLLVASISTSTDGPGIERFAFLTGTWRHEKGGTVTEETWIEPKAGATFGVGRTLRGDQTVFFEFLRIEQRGNDTFYNARPRGRPPTEHKMIAFDAGVVTFENPAHDFPQRIVYRQVDADTIDARIEGRQNGQSASESWRYTRVK